MHIVRSTNLFEGVIFDVDGTLLDTMPVWHNAGANFLLSLGIQPEEGLGDRLFTETPESAANYLIDNYGLKMSTEEVSEGINQQVDQFYFQRADFKAGAKELLMKLKESGSRLTVATSTSRYCIEAAFRRLGIMDVFDAILTCDEVGATKANPAIFYEAVHLMKTEIPQTWVFEDGLYAIRTARKEGFRTVGVYDETSLADQEEIMRIADFYYTSLEDFEMI